MRLSPFRPLVPLSEWGGPIADADTIGEWDRSQIEKSHVPGAVLMERAAEACTARIGPPSRNRSHAVVLVGPGNNGGDGSAIARLLRGLGWAVTLVLAAKEERLRGDAATNFRAAKAAGAHILRADPTALDEIRSALHDAPVWIDALLGVGNEEAPRGIIETVLVAATDVVARREIPPHVLAVDLPTGLTTSGGDTPGAALRASETVALGAPKPAHFSPGGIACCGDVFVGPIGVIPERWEDGPTPRAVAHERAAAQMVWRSRSDHKTSSGHLLIVAGSDEMPGAAILSTTAALRAGAGMVSLASAETVRQAAIQREPSIIGVPIDDLFNDDGSARPEAFARYSAFLVGPGLGVTAAQRARLRALLGVLDGRPCLVDADGLTILASTDGIVAASTGPLLLTPHPGELARLLGVAADEVISDIPDAAARCATQYSAIVCAKSAGVWIDDGHEQRAVYGAEPVLATAGSGDVLAGLIAALMGRMSPRDAASVAAFVHVEAGRTLAREAPGSFPTAYDIAESVAIVLQRLKAGRV